MARVIKHIIQLTRANILFRLVYECAKRLDCAIAIEKQNGMNVHEIYCDYRKMCETFERERETEKCEKSGSFTNLVGFYSVFFFRSLTSFYFFFVFWVFFAYEKYDSLLLPIAIFVGDESSFSKCEMMCTI